MTMARTNGRSAIALMVGFFFLMEGSQTSGVESKQSLPRVIEEGLNAYASGGAEAAVAAWLKGGPGEGERVAEAEADKFKRMERFFGRYKSYESIDTKDIGKSSKVIYLALNFERGAIFASFIVYKTDKDWVVTGWDTNTKPQLIFPWLMPSPKSSTVQP